ncbi:MAG: hypothetical protein JKX72_04680 [Robiginitomaculum sp.]|nr:hypothetical protein [Robiginitomaculum sp.]
MKCRRAAALRARPRRAGVRDQSPLGGDKRSSREAQAPFTRARRGLPRDTLKNNPNC